MADEQWELDVHVMPDGFPSAAEAMAFAADLEAHVKERFDLHADAGSRLSITPTGGTIVQRDLEFPVHSREVAQALQVEVRTFVRQRDLPAEWGEWTKERLVIEGRDPDQDYPFPVRILIHPLAEPVTP